jgi:hypothetical protein
MPDEKNIQSTDELLTLNKANDLGTNHNINMKSGTQTANPSEADNESNFNRTGAVSASPD